MKKRPEIAALGTQVAFVHMGREDVAAQFFAKFGAEQEHRVSDPRRELYAAFSLRSGTFNQLFGLQVLKREIRDRMYLTYGIGKVVGSISQLPGAFLIHHSQVVKAFRHDSVADEVDYVAMAK